MSKILLFMAMKFMYLVCGLSEWDVLIQSLERGVNDEKNS